MLISALLISSSSFIALAQEEAPNAGMPIRDADGNTYKIIMTEEGVWMAENLRTTKYNDGTPIPMIRDKASWENTKTAGYGWFSNDPKYRQACGAIYNWHAVQTGKLCPAGWHVPTEAEWNELMDYAGTPEKSGDNPCRLKEKGTAHWKSPNTGGTNDIYFTALPAGEISYFHKDEEPGERANWWTSTEDLNNVEPGKVSDNADIIGVSYDFHSKTVGTYEKEAGLAVRCKMNE